MSAPGDQAHGHERVEELVALLVLDGLDDDEATELAWWRTEYAGCAECDRLLRDYREVAARVADTLPRVTVPPEATRRLLEEATGDQGRGDSPAGGVAARDAAARGATGRHAVGVQQRTRRRRGAPLRTRVLAGVAAVALVAGGGVAGFAVSQARGPDTSPVGSVSPDALAGYLADPTTRLVAFPRTGASRLSVAYQPGHRDAWLIADELPRPTHDRVYQLWYRVPGSSAMAPSGTFRPGADGSVAVPVTMAAHVDRLAVTVEPDGGSRRPTTKPLTVVDP